MSYDIRLKHPVTGKTLELDSPHQMKGGTYALGGTTSCELNITYNYSKWWNKAFGEGENSIRSHSIRDLYGKFGRESIPILEKAIANLGDDVDEGYWKVTEGNAKAALIQLLTLAKLRPDGIWDGD